MKTMKDDSSIYISYFKYIWWGKYLDEKDEYEKLFFIFNCVLRYSISAVLLQHYLHKWYICTYSYCLFFNVSFRIVLLMSKLDNPRPTFILQQIVSFPFPLTSEALFINLHFSILSMVLVLVDMHLFFFDSF